MYKAFFQLKENPFNVTSDSSFYFSSRSHAEAYSHLLFGIEERKGIISISGEVGTGKTTLCRTLVNRLDKRVKTALILNPKFSDLQLLQFIVHDFGIRGNFRSKFGLVNALNDFLIDESSAGNNVVVIIDEAQNLDPEQLESIRLLSNLETEKEKLLQIVLVGQPELEKMLAMPELRQINQRIAVRYCIHPLNESEVQEYIQHRLTLAAIDPSDPPRIEFTKSAVKAIYRYSQGIPRLINILCDRCLLASFVNERDKVEHHDINQCAMELYL